MVLLLFVKLNAVKKQSGVCSHEVNKAKPPMLSVCRIDIEAKY